ncbi:MAG: monovalent cation/H+ antiporter subunit D family protein [Rhodospirillales bacterium]|nr:monovalent cation/H+ antiporter subunit D family protein [Rhodospirillales bacterium]
MTGLPDPGLLAALAIAIPLVGAIGILLTSRWPDVREGISLTTGVVLFCNVALIATALEAGEEIRISLAEPVSNIGITLEVEPLGMLFALVASGLWIVTTVYAIGYMRGHHEKNQTRFYTFFAISIASAMGVAFAGNLLTLFVFYEALTLATFPLVTHARTPEARKGGRTYLGILLGTSIGFQLLAIIATYWLAGTLDFVPGGILQNVQDPVVTGALLVLFVFGVGKAAVMPFHRWLPAAMVAPTPVSALLHAVAVVKAGVFTILKIATFIIGFDLLRDLVMTDVLQWGAAFTIIAASLIAMTKDNLKARLAYSTVSQLSYIVLAALLATEAGFLGGGLHIATHAFGKITLFFCAGAILVAAHKTEISQLDGLGRVMPWTFAAFLIGSLSIIGLPPLCGLWSKWLLVAGAIDADKAIFAAVLFLSTLLNIAYLLPIPFRAFFRPLPAGVPAKRHEAPAACLAAIGFTTLGCFVLFFYPDPLIALLEGAAITAGALP